MEKTVVFADAEKYVKSRLSEKRFRHTMGVVETAETLAKRYGADVDQARLAALLHDVTKEYDYQKQLKTCTEWRIILDEVTYSESALLHAVTGAELARRMFGAGDAVCRAIRSHTTGAAEMTILDKIICLADYIEPNRVFPGVDHLRTLSAESLDRALLEAIDGTIVHTIQMKKIVHPDSLLARNALLRTIGTCDSAIEKG